MSTARPAPDRPVAGRRDWLAWLIALTLALGVAGQVSFQRDLGRPFAGFVAFRNIPQNRWYFDFVTPPWWPGVTPAWFVGRAQALLRLDDQPFGLEQRRQYAAAQAAGRTRVTFTVAGQVPGATETRLVPLTVFTWADLIDLRLPDAILFASFWLLALVLYRVRPNDPLNRVAVIMFCLVGLNRWLNQHTLFPDDDALTRLLEATAYAITGPLLGPAVIHFGLAYPRPSRWLTPRLMKGVYAIGLVLAAGRLLARLAWDRVPAVNWAQFDDWMLYGTGVLTGAGLLTLLGHCGWSAWRYRHEPGVQRQAILVGVGCLAALPPIGVSLEKVFAGEASQSQYFLNNLDLRYLIVAIPLAITFASLRYRAFRSSHPLVVVVLVLASSALGASLTAALIQLSAPSSSRPPFALLWLAFAAMTMFAVTQTSWQGALGRLLRWEERSYREVKQFGETISGQLELATLPGQIAEQLVTVLRVERSAVYLRAGTTLRLAGQAGLWPAPPPDQLTLAADSLSAWPRPVWLNADAAPSGALAILPAVPGLEVMARLWLPEPVGGLGLLAVGKRADEAYFDERDLEIIELVATQTALRLLAVQQIDELRRVPARLTEAQKHERFRLAQDLHDTLQQRLGGLQPLLEAALHFAQHDPARVEATLRRCIDEVEQVARTVTRIRQDLAPPELARSPREAYQALAERFQARTGLRLALLLPVDLESSLALPAQHELFLVIQQALDNIAEHAGATHVEVCLARQGQHLAFSVRDDGVGFQSGRREAAARHGSFGLISIEARISSLGGQVFIESEPGTGTRVFGRVPAARAAEAA